MKSWPKVKLGQVGVSSNISQNHSSLARKSYLPPIHLKSWINYEIRSLLFAPICFYLPLFGPKIPILSIFTLTCLYLPLFTYIWPNLALITLNWSYLPIISLICAILTLDRYSSIETAPMCKILSNRTITHGYIAFQRIGGSIITKSMEFGCLSSHWQFFCMYLLMLYPISNVKAIGQLVMEDLGETESVVTNAVVLVLGDLQVISPSVQTITTHGNIIY